MSELLYSDVEEEVRASVRGLLGQRSAVSQVLARIENGLPYDQTLWRTLSTEMGLSGMAIPERFGGGGASLRESAVVLEELGRSLAPVPFLTSAVIATSALLASSSRAEDPRFVQSGLFRYSRHPNFFFEQAQWWVLFAFGAIAAGSVLQWTVVGPVLLTLLFLGSTRFTESISLSRYPEYRRYQETTSAQIPWFPSSDPSADPAVGKG